MTWHRATIVTAPLVLLLGLASGWLAGSGYDNPWFDALAKPGFMPPAWLFPLVWSALYILMGLALGQVLGLPPSPARRGALTLFAFQLLLNLAWSPIFFAAHQIDLALGVILFLDLAVLATIAAFHLIRPVAAWLLLPYPLWLALATALNWSILRLNG